MFDLVPDLPDDTLIETVRFSPLIRKSLNAAGLKTIGEIRAMSENELRRMRGIIGTGSLAYLREALGVRVDFHVEARPRRVARHPWSQAEESVLRSLITRGNHARTIGAEMMNLSAEAIEANGSRAEGKGESD